MKTKYFFVCCCLIGIFVLALLYNLLATGILISNARNRNILTPDMDYRFAMASMDGQSLILYHLTSSKWPDAFIHRVKITLDANGFSGQIKNIHLPPYQLALWKYGAYLPEALDSYQPASNFIDHWPLSIALFDLISPHTTIDFSIKTQHLNSYQLQFKVIQNYAVMLSGSTTLNIVQDHYDITRGQIQILDNSLIKKIRAYAQSRHQTMPLPEFTTTEKN